MQENQMKKTIYIRTFSALLVTYLILMVVFSTFQILREKQVVELEMGTYASQISNTITNLLKDHIGSNLQITDISKVKSELIDLTSYFTHSDTQMALFTGDYNLIYHTKDDWQCGYSVDKGNNEFSTVDAYLNPKDWFSEQEIKEIEGYLYANPKAKKKGDIAGYYVDIEGFWLDEEMIIPDKVIIYPMLADSFNENGDVVSGSGTPTDDISYSSGYEDTRDLPYFKHGHIRPVYNDYGKGEKQTELRNMVKDKEKLKTHIEQLPAVTSTEIVKIDLLTYRYYLPIPYQHTVTMIDNNKQYSEFWTVIARDVNLLERSAPTLAFLWLSCLIAFLTVAFILSNQTYKLYKRREELENNRKEMTKALAHDLKTPLSIISGYAQNLIENVQTDKREQYASNIKTNVDRMDKIILEMLDLSKLEADSFSTKLENVSLNEVSSKIINRYSQNCTEKHITTHLEGDGVIKADAVLIERVIDNFFVNALEHTPNGGIIRIKILSDRLEFYNSGSHIPEQKINEIWDAYKKVDISRSHTKGTGLGLSIARTILEKYKFPYGAKNNDDGVVFWFKFNQ
ncbi:Histidine kinase-, DNA gyrase B-, and HSP90-like ATPase [Desulfonispora thiosulfatigenes DSM 11270]|uniref:histidine kinase n=1 Tax=Desulfonispora thiosulfatigenes DSM 11270 TaxID=656914 RepID=A0A1W1UVX5_DESTI|nr:HAMP domain-containing sensor histidine kinase [Desulfonispora thiosulfatigenes]SMB85186.1 Histidine kinase-, DNA gyrase B-, and HSP90-like ATPase [Desulfonispora thiosulfatigenes DSM 11270]